MPDIDERVVSMKFDNKQFEKGVQTSIISLDKLKTALNFSPVASVVSNTTSKISSLMTKLSDTVHGAFDKLKKAPADNVTESLEYIAGQVSTKGRVISNEVQKLVNGIENEFRKLYSFTVKQPFTDGFQEYELKMGSVQTIMQSTGESLETVTGYLEELNKYADRTIYSFSDMTSNIGKFTNAGVKLEDAVAAIQGVSNVAAVSGAGTQEASRAMYNFAQALSSGVVRLIDWKSIENANMATVEFKQALLDSAEALGTVNKNGENYVTTTGDMNGKVSTAFNAVSGFNDSLSHQWMTTEVLVDALKKYTDETTAFGKKAFAAAQDVKTWSQLLDTIKEALGSGWSKTFELVIGNFEEAKELFTSINNVLSPIIDKTADFRNNLIQAWVDNGGRKRLLDDIKSLLAKFEAFSDKVENFVSKSLKVILGPQYQKIFGDFAIGMDKASNSAENMQKKLQQWQAAYDIWTKGTYGNGQARKDAIEEIFKDNGESYKAIQSILDSVVAGNINLYESFDEIKKEAEQANVEEEKLKETTKKLGDEYSNAVPLVQRMQTTFRNLRTTVKLMSDGITNLYLAIKNVARVGVNTFLDVFDFGGVSKDVKNVAVMFNDFTVAIKNASEKTEALRKIFGKIFTTVNNVYGWISTAFFAISDVVKSVFETLTTNQTVINKVSTTLQNVSGIILGFKEGMGNLLVAVINLAGVFVNSFLRVFKFDTLTSDVNELINKFVEWTKKIREGSTDTEKWRKKFDKFFKFVNKVYDILKATFETIIGIVSWIVDRIKAVISAISEWKSNIDEHSGIYRAWNSIHGIIFDLIVLFGKIKDRIKDAFGPKVAVLVTNIRLGLDNVLNSIKKIIKNGLEKVVGWLEKIAGFDFSAINLDWIDNIANLKIGDLSPLDKLKNIGVNLENPFTKVGDWIKSIFTAENLKKIAEGAIAVGNSILNALGSLDWSRIWAAASFILFVVMGVKIVKLISTVTDVFSGLKGVFDSVKKVFDGLKESLTDGIESVFDAITTKLEESTMEVLLATVMALMGTLITLSNLPTDKVLGAAVSIAIVLKALEGVVKLITNLMQTNASTAGDQANLLGAQTKKEMAHALTLAGMGVIILAFAAVAAAAALMVYLLDNTQHIWRGVAFLVGALILIGGLATVFFFVSRKFGNATMAKNMLGIGAVIAALASTLLLVALSLKILDKVELSAGTVTAMVLIPLALGGVMAAFMALAGHFKMNATKQFKALGTAMVLMGAALDVILPVIITLGVMQKLGIDTGSIAGDLAGIMIIFGLMTIMFGAAVKLVAVAPLKKIIAFGAIITAFMMVLTAFTMGGGLAAVAKFFANGTWIANIFKLAAAILILGVSIAAVFGIFVLMVELLKTFIGGITPTKLNELAGAFMKVGLGIAGIGIGVLSLVAAMTLLPQAALGLVAFGQALEQHGNEIARTMSVLAILIISAFLAGWVAMKAPAIVTLIVTIVEIFIVLAEFLHGHVAEFVGYISMILTDAVALLGGILGTLVGSVVSLIIIFIATIASQLGHRAGDIWGVIKGSIKVLFRTIVYGVVGTVADLLFQVFKKIGEKLGIDGDYVADWFDVEGWIDDVNAEDLEKLDKYIEDENKSLHDKSENIKKEIRGQSNSLKTAVGGLTESLLPKDVQNAIPGMSNMINSASKEIKNASDEYLKTAMESRFGIIIENEELAKALKESEANMSYDDWLATKAIKRSSASGRLYTETELRMQYEQFQLEAAQAVFRANTEIGKKQRELKKQQELGIAGYFANGIENFATGGGAGDKLGKAIDSATGAEIDLSGISFNAKAAEINLSDYQLLLDTDRMAYDFGTDENGNIMLPEDMTQGELFQQYGLNGAENFTEGAEEGFSYNTDEFSAAGEALGDALMNTFDGVSKERAYKAGQDIVDETAKGTNYQLEKEKHKLQARGRDVGDALAEGMKEGYVRKQRDIRHEAYRTGDAMLKAYCDATGIASPSKEMRKLGVYTIQGLLLGLRDGQNSVDQTTTNTANSIINTLKSPMDFLISYFNGELQYDPSIRPTMDISGVRTGMTGINGMINGSTYQLGAEVSASMSQAALDKLDYATDIRNGYNDGNVVNAIGKLNKDINTLNDSMSNMSVVMDTGALVGQLSEGMDYALGQRQYMRGRGM
jgi:tape measure domain-containing protein